jgi:uncharacterized protein YqhQ
VRTLADVASRIRLGGMALENGVLVHGPRYWACAVRSEDGAIEAASGLKPFRSAEVRSGVLRGPLKLAEVFALLPVVRRRLPAARLPFERPRVVATLVGSAGAIRGVRASPLAPVAQEALAALLAVAPAAFAIRGSSIAEYHGAEHISIGTYEHGEARPREHERCGSHLVGPLVLTSAAGGLLARAVPPHLQVLARAGAALGAMAASIELFAWMVKNERHPLARALARPGHELQHRLLTADPTAEQLEVANAALTECLRLESGQDGGRERPEERPPT